MRPQHERGSASDRPRRRAMDRIEELTRGAVLGAGLLALLIAALTGVFAHGAVTDRAEIEGRDRFPVIATVAQQAPAVPGVEGFTPLATHAPAVWTAPDGSPRTGELAIGAGTALGTRVPVWVDRYGALQSAPPTPADAVIVGVLTAFGVLLVSAGALAGVEVLVRRLTFAADLRRWEREWRRVEPRWRRSAR